MDRPRVRKNTATKLEQYARSILLAQEYHWSILPGPLEIYKMYITENSKFMKKKLTHSGTSQNASCPTNISHGV